MYNITIIIVNIAVSGIISCLSLCMIFPKDEEKAKRIRTLLSTHTHDDGSPNEKKVSYNFF